MRSAVSALLLVSTVTGGAIAQEVERSPVEALRQVSRAGTFTAIETSKGELSLLQMLTTEGQLFAEAVGLAPDEAIEILERHRVWQHLRSPSSQEDVLVEGADSPGARRISNELGEIEFLGASRGTSRVVASILGLPLSIEVRPSDSGIEIVDSRGGAVSRAKIDSDSNEGGELWSDEQGLLARLRRDARGRVRELETMVGLKIVYEYDSPLNEWSRKSVVDSRSGDVLFSMHRGDDLEPGTRLVGFMPLPTAWPLLQSGTGSVASLELSLPLDDTLSAPYLFVDISDTQVTRRALAVDVANGIDDRIEFSPEDVRVVISDPDSNSRILFEVTRARPVVAPALDVRRRSLSGPLKRRAGGSGLSLSVLRSDAAYITHNLWFTDIPWSEVQTVFWYWPGVFSIPTQQFLRQPLPDEVLRAVADWYGTWLNYQPLTAQQNQKLNQAISIANNKLTQPGCAGLFNGFFFSGTTALSQLQFRYNGALPVAAMGRSRLLINDDRVSTRRQFALGPAFFFQGANERAYTLIHEALHRAGMGEDRAPWGTAQQIQDMVRDNCQ